MRLQAKKIENVDVERFLSKISVESSGCWSFKSCKVKGYGVFCINKGNFYAHRVSYSVFVGDMDVNLVLDHTCMNRGCVNPDHLREVTHEINLLENSMTLSAENKIKTHCKWGHEFTKENTRIRKDGNRLCSKCTTINNRRASAQLSEKRFNLGLPSKWKGGGLL